MCLKSIWYLVSAFLERKEKPIQIKPCSGWQTKLWNLRMLEGKETLHSMFLTPSDAHRSTLKKFEPEKKKNQTNHICNHPKEFLSKESLLYISCQWVHHQPPSSIPSSYLQIGHSHRCWDRGLKAWGQVPTALRLLRSPKQFTRILQKDEEKAVTKLHAALPCQWCTVTGRWGCLFIASGTGFRSAFRHFSVGVYRAPVDTVRETLPNSIFTSIATIRVNTINLKESDIISKASHY